MYKIPVMSIQSVAVELDSHPRLVDLRAWLINKVEEEKSNWGIRGKGFKITYDLERQWYPVFCISNRWLANAFIEHLAKYKPWRKK